MLFINPLESSDSYVYHYTRLETALDQILRAGTIRLNPFSAVNDPRENKTWTFATLVRADRTRSLQEWNTLSDRVSTILKGNAKVVCFSSDRPEISGRWQPEALPGRGFALPNMWHHYADRQQGVCLVFVRERLEATFGAQLGGSGLLAGRVEYSDNGILPRLQDDPFSVNLFSVGSDADLLRVLARHLDQWSRQLFLRKLRSWSNEQEYRWVYLDDNPHPRDVSFSDALVGVTVGAAVSKQDYSRVRKACVRHNAQIARLVWRNGYPAVEDLGFPALTDWGPQAK